MSRIEKIELPISNERANENVIRIVAFQVVILTTITLLFQNYFLALFLAIDFSIRAFTNGKLSVLKLIGTITAQLLKIEPKPIFAPPKKFAALLGFIFSLLIAALLFLQLNTIALTIGSLLIFCAILESVFGICIGCYVYTFISKIK
jgi:hypothetical protein